ncbi:MAG: sodium:proton antiporter [Alistipes sp.]|nr:sodium:proton antiporter [Candidatus Alistipes equi]
MNNYLVIIIYMESFLIPILLLLGGILVGVIIKSFSKYLFLPYTVTLFIVGVIVGLLYRFGAFDGLPALTFGVERVANMDPNLVLYIFLPILIFDAAYGMNLHVFKKTLFNATILAGPGLVVSMLLVACFIMALTLLFTNGESAWTWSFALMFGGMISATDPVAVVALLHELKTSRQFTTLVDGESLLNDGTGIVCFMLFYGIYAGNPTEMNPITYFTWVCIGSCIIGYLIAKITLWFITKVNTDEMIQNCAMIIAAYVTFIIAQFTFDISGVIALVVYGHIVAQQGKPLFSTSSNQFIGKFWGLLAHISNTLIFIIVGIIIVTKVDVTWMKILQLILLYIALNLIRYAMIFLFKPVVQRNGYGLSTKEALILGWSGLRGALGMTLALMVAYTESIPEEVRDSILFFTAGIVTLTLCINGTTAKGLLRRLNLIKGDSVARNKREYEIKEGLRNNCIKFIDDMKNKQELADTNWDIVEKFIPEKTLVPEKSLDKKDYKTELRLMILSKERDIVNNMYERGAITKYSYLKLLDSVDGLYDYEGTMPLSNRDSVISISSSYLLQAMFSLMKAVRINIFQKLLRSMMQSSISKQYDLCSGFIYSQNKSKSLINHVDNLDIIEQDIESEVLNSIRAEIDMNIKRTMDVFEEIKKYFPDIYSLAVTDRAVRLLLSHERMKLSEWQYNGMLTEEENGVLLAEINRKLEK